MRTLQGGLFGFAPSGNTLFFFLRWSGPVELWRSDGTPEGTLKVALVCSENCWMREPPVVVDGTLVFVGKDEVIDISTEKRSSVLEDLETGKISADVAMRLLRGEEE